MFTYTPQEVEAAFRKSKNPNAALKNFLKKECPQGPQAEALARFVKDFKPVAISTKEGVIAQYVERHKAKFERHFLLFVRYLYPECADSALSEIVETHADNFNATYKVEGETFTFIDEKTFKKIVGEVQKIVKDTFTKAEVPFSRYLEEGLYLGLFEEQVLRKVVPLTGK